MPSANKYVPLRVTEGAFADWPTVGAGQHLFVPQYNHTTGIHEYVAVATSAHTHAGEDITSGTVADARIASILTGKTLTTPTIASFANAAHTHQNAAGGGQLDHGLALAGLGDDDHPQYHNDARGDARYQPLDADLTAIAALATTSFGRARLTDADAAALRSAAALGTIATESETNYLLATGARTGATSQRQAFTSGISAGSVAAGLSDTFGAKGYFYGPFDDSTTQTNLISDTSVATTGNTANALIAFSFTAAKDGTHNYGSLYGVNGNVYHRGTAGTTAALIACTTNIGLQGASSAGSVSTGYHYMAGTPTRAGGSTTTMGVLFGMLINNQGNSWVGAAYGLYIAGQSGSASNIALLTEEGLVTFNENGDPNTDFRVEGDTDANLLFTDASADRVGIGTNAPNNKLDVVGTVQCDGLRVDVTPTAETPPATHTALINFNGTNYKVLCLAA